MRVHGQVRQRVGADGVQRGAAVPGDHLDVPVEQYPVARPRPVAVAQRVPAVMCLRVGEHRHHVRRGRVGLDADVGPFVQRPRIGAAPAHPALLARRLGPQRQREAGEGRARLPVVGAVDAAGLPDQRFHLGRRPGPRQPQVVPGHADDRRSQRAVPREAWDPWDPWEAWETGVAGSSRASRCAGTLVGDVMSATVPWATVKPVITPQVDRPTSAVDRCHVGFVVTPRGPAGS